MQRNIVKFIVEESTSFPLAVLHEIVPSFRCLKPESNNSSESSQWLSGMNNTC
jgi:hypothetical protein